MSLTRFEKYVARRLIEQYGPEEIRATQGEVASEQGVSRRALNVLFKKMKKAGYIHKMGNGHYRISPFFWWIPERGVNSKSAFGKFWAYHMATINKKINVLEFHYGGTTLEEGYEAAERYRSTENQMQALRDAFGPDNCEHRQDLGEGA
jgi:hypothetical protein